MIETRFALPVRSPTPFIVPWTCARAGVDGGERVRHAALGVVVAVEADPDAGRRPRRTTARGRLRHLVRAATSRSCRTGTTVLGAAARGRLEALERVGAVVAEAVEEVLGVVDDALAGARRGTRPTPRSSRGSRRGRRGRPSRGAAPRSCRRSCTPGRSRSPGPAGRRPPRRVTPRRRVMPNAAICAWSNVSRRQELEELELLGVRGREPGLDQVHAELVQAMGDAHLLVRGQRHALALHPVAQGRVVELDGGHATCGAGDGTGTGSSHSR